MALAAMEEDLLIALPLWVDRESGEEEEEEEEDLLRATHTSTVADCPKGGV